MKKNIRLIIMIAVIAAVLLCTAYCGLSYVKESEFEKIQVSEVYSVCTATKKLVIKSEPLDFAFSRGTVAKDSSVKVLASNKDWSKIVYFTESGVKSGYVKTNGLGEKSEGTIIASSLDFNSYSIKLSVDEQMELSPALTPYYSNERVVFTSDNEAVAAVEGNVVKGIASGDATITASTSKLTKSIKVRVVLSPEEIKFTGGSFSILKGDSDNLAKRIECENKSKYNITFTSSDDSVIKISDSKAIAVGEGEATVTAVAGDKTARCKYIVHTKSGNAARELNMPNAYGNTIDYHPSVLYFENKWNGYTYWCAFTPYEKCNDLYENPHILASNDLKKWETPSGFSNPLEPAPSDYEYGISYNSDTELVYNTDTNKLECWWRYYDRRNRRVCLYRKTTSDGVHWSGKEVTMLSDDLSRHDFLSPALVYENHTYKMWAIDLRQGYAIQYYESQNGTQWSSPKNIKVEYEDTSVRHWHLDVIHTPKGYEMLLSAFPKNKEDHLHMSLYYAFSKDNQSYSKARLLIQPTRGTSGWDNQGLYRSSLLFANNKYYCFYSGINTKKGPVGIGVISGDNVFHMN